MASTPRWGGLRIEPYDPDAKDADGDGIVQEGTAWERPAGVRLVDELGRAIARGQTASSPIKGMRYVDAQGRAVDYTPKWTKFIGQSGQASSESGLARLGIRSLQDRGHRTILDMAKEVYAGIKPESSKVPESAKMPAEFAQRIIPGVAVVNANTSKSMLGRLRDLIKGIKSHDTSQRLSPVSESVLQSLAKQIEQVEEKFGPITTKTEAFFALKSVYPNAEIIWHSPAHLSSIDIPELAFTHALLFEALNEDGLPQQARNRIRYISFDSKENFGGAAGLGEFLNKLGYHLVFNSDSLQSALYAIDTDTAFTVASEIIDAEEQLQRQLQNLSGTPEEIQRKAEMARAALSLTTRDAGPVTRLGLLLALAEKQAAIGDPILGLYLSAKLTLDHEMSHIGNFEAVIGDAGIVFEESLDALTRDRTLDTATTLSDELVQAISALMNGADAATLRDEIMRERHRSAAMRKLMIDELRKSPRDMLEVNLLNWVAKNYELVLDNLSNDERNLMFEFADLLTSKYGTSAITEFIPELRSLYLLGELEGILREMDNDNGMFSRIVKEENSPHANYDSLSKHRDPLYGDPQKQRVEQSPLRRDAREEGLTSKQLKTIKNGIQKLMDWMSNKRDARHDREPGAEGLYFLEDFKKSLEDFYQSSEPVTAERIIKLFLNHSTQGTIANEVRADLFGILDLLPGLKPGGDIDPQATRSDIEQMISEIDDEVDQISRTIRNLVKGMTKWIDKTFPYNDREHWASMDPDFREGFGIALMYGGDEILSDALEVVKLNTLLGFLRQFRGHATGRLDMLRDSPQESKALQQYAIKQADDPSHIIPLCSGYPLLTGPTNSPVEVGSVDMFGIPHPAVSPRPPKRRFRDLSTSTGLNTKAQPFRRRLRIEPYDPDAKDGDGDGIVQDGTAWERPAGTRIITSLGREVGRGMTTFRPSRLNRIVDADGNDVDYTPKWQRRIPTTGLERITEERYRPRRTTMDVPQPSAPPKEPSSALGQIGFPTLAERGHGTVDDYVASSFTPDIEEVAPEQPKPEQLTGTAKAIADIRSGPNGESFLPDIPADIGSWPPELPYQVGSLPEPLPDRENRPETREILEGAFESFGYLFRATDNRSPSDPDSNYQFFDGMTPEDIAEWLLEKLGYNGDFDDLIQDVNDRLERRASLFGQYINDEATVVVNTNIEDFFKILDSGRIKSQFETGSSTGFYDPPRRSATEYKQFGVPEDTASSLRPIYGTIRIDESRFEKPNRNRGRLYGKIVMVLKPSVRSRTTFTIGDSLTSAEPHGQRIDIGSFATSDSWTATALRREIANLLQDILGLSFEHDTIELPGGEEVSGESMRKAIDPYGETVTDVPWGEFEYIEAQVHGGVSLLDIDHIEIPTSVRDSDVGSPQFRALLERLARLKIAVRDDQGRNYE